MSIDKYLLLNKVYKTAQDNDTTVHIVVDVRKKNVCVPIGYAIDNLITLNISWRAVSDLIINIDEFVEFSAQFSGKTSGIFIPFDAIASVYIKETGLGYSFDIEEEPPRPKLTLVKG